MPASAPCSNWLKRARVPDSVIVGLEQSGDEMRYRRILMVTATGLTALFAVGAAFQSSLFVTLEGAPHTDAMLSERLFANFSGVLIFAVAFVTIPLRRFGTLMRVPIVLAICGVAALARMIVQALLEVHPRGLQDWYLADLMAGFTIGLVSSVIALLLADYEYRLRLQERTTSAQSLRAARALEALQAEELRVRREVAEGLHGTVQQRLVLVGVEVAALRDRLDQAGSLDDRARRDFHRIIESLDHMREQDVREMSQLLYPNGIDLGLSQAVRMLMRRVPASIAARVHISPRVVEYDDPAHGGLSVAERLMIVRLLEEGVSNAFRHGGAAKLQLHLDIEQVDDRHELVLRLDDNGVGVDGSGRLHGLERLVDRVRDRGGVVDLLPSPVLSGARLQLRLPVAEPTPAPAVPASPEEHQTA